MPKMKWDLNGKGVQAAGLGEGMAGYSGPDLPKGSWPAKIKRMTVHQIKSAANKGKPRISVLLEVQSNTLDGKEQYHGAPVWDNLNIIDSSVPFVNAFLHSLTDGSDRAKRAIEAAFWDADKGPDFKKVTNKKGDEETHITKIGRVKIDSPTGEVLVQITTRPGTDQQGNYRPEVTGYMPYTGPLANKASDDDDEVVEDDDDDIDVDDDDDDIDDDDDYGDDDDDMLTSKPF